MMVTFPVWGSEKKNDQKRAKCVFCRVWTIFVCWLGVRGKHESLVFKHVQSLTAICSVKKNPITTEI